VALLILELVVTNSQNFSETVSTYSPPSSTAAEQPTIVNVSRNSTEIEVEPEKTMDHYAGALEQTTNRYAGALEQTTDRYAGALEQTTDRYAGALEQTTLNSGTLEQTTLSSIITTQKADTTTTGQYRTNAYITMHICCSTM